MLDVANPASMLVQTFGCFQVGTPFVAMPFVTSSFLLLVVRPGALFVASLLLMISRLQSVWHGVLNASKSSWDPFVLSRWALRDHLHSALH